MIPGEVSSTAREVSVELLPAEAVERAGDIWLDVEAGVEEVPLSCSWAWTQTWLGRYGDLMPHRFAVARDPGGPCGVALVTEGVRRRRAGVPVRTLHIGTAGEPVGEGVFVEYNDLLATAGSRRAFASALVGALAAGRGWDELVLDGFAPDAAADVASGDLRFQLRREPSPTLDLRQAREGGEVLGLLRKSVRQRVQRSIRGFGEIETEWADEPDAALDVLEELIRLHQGRWRALGRRGAFAHPRVSGFHRDLVRRLAGEGRTVAFRARSATGTIGCLYGFVDRNRLLFYQGGLGSLGQDPRAKPGLVAHALFMQECMERGLDEYDFLAGDSRYKRELSNAERTLVWARGPARTPRALAASAAVAATSVLRRFR